jgi:hypothetical protein
MQSSVMINASYEPGGKSYHHSSQAIHFVPASGKSRKKKVYRKKKAIQARDIKLKNQKIDKRKRRKSQLQCALKYVQVESRVSKLVRTGFWSVFLASWFSVVFGDLILVGTDRVFLIDSAIAAGYLGDSRFVAGCASKTVVTGDEASSEESFDAVAEPDDLVVFD